MPWSESLYGWLIYSALVSLVILAIGSTAVLLCRQPARRLRIIELSLAACLIAPLLGMIPGYPQLTIFWRHAAPPQPQAISAPLPTGQVPEPVVSQPDFVLHSVPDMPPKAMGEPTETPARAWNVRLWLVGLYFLGVVIGIAWWLVGMAALVRIIWIARAAPPHCREILAQIAGRRSARVRLLTSRLAKQPFASVGVAVQLPPQRAAWGRAVIVLPENLCDDEQAVRWALAHEWTHIERRDFRAWFVAGLARVLFFYQPLVWWLRRQLRLCQDYVADALASRQAAQPEDYAEFLTRRAAAGLLHPAIVGLGMGFSKSELYRRVVMLVQNRPLESRPPRLWTVSVTCAALLSIAAVAALTISPRRATGSGSDADTGVAGPAAAVSSGDARKSNTSPPDTGKVTGTPADRTNDNPQAHKPAKAPENAGAILHTTTTKSGEMVIRVRPLGNCSIGGTVISEATGKPVAGAQIYLHYNVTHGSIFVNTNSDGTFEITNIPTGPFSLCSTNTPGYQDTAYSPEGKPGPYPPFLLKDGEHRAGIVLKMKQASRVSGKIMDENGKAPQSKGWDVLAWYKNDGGEGYRTQYAIVDHADGSYVIDGLGKSPVYVMAINWRAAREGDAWPPIYYPSAFSRSDAKQVAFDRSPNADGVNITLRKEGGLTVEGTVRDEAGKPVPEAFVVAHRRDMLFDFDTAYTDAEGHYQIKGLGPGRFLVHVDAVHRGFVRTRMPIDLDTASKKTRRDFTLRRGVLISGKFVDEKGENWQIGTSYGYAAQISKDRPGRSQFELNEGNFSLTDFRNKHRPENAAKRSPGAFLLGEGDYDCDQAIFPTTSTFIIQGMMPGHIRIGLSPNKENQQVVKILRAGRDILTSGIETKPGEEIKDVTIVIGKQ